jgi:hypothetical protein
MRFCFLSVQAIEALCLLVSSGAAQDVTNGTRYLRRSLRCVVLLCQTQPTATGTKERETDRESFAQGDKKPLKCGGPNFTLLIVRIQNFISQSNNNPSASGFPDKNEINLPLSVSKGPAF